MNITLKNIPPDLYEQFKELAEGNRRSINSEMLVCMERAVRSQRVSDEALLEQARQLRARIKGPFLTDAMLQQAKEEGRP